MSTQIRRPHRAGTRTRRRLSALSLGLSALLFATACGTGEDPNASEQSEGASSAVENSEAGASGQKEEDGQGQDASASEGGDEQKDEAKQKDSYEPAAQGEGSGDTEALSSLSFSMDGKKPKIEAKTPLKAEEPSTRVLAEGEGEQVSEGDIVALSSVAVDPKTGEQQADNFSGPSEVFTVDSQLKEQNAVLYRALRTAKPGSVVAYFVPGSGDGQAQGAAQDQLVVFRVEKTLWSPPKDDSAKPEKLEVEQLREGDGDEVSAQDQVTVHYTGVTWKDGQVFDSSYGRGQPATFPLDGVIEGWSEGLEGQKVGSRVLLTIPAEQAYGEQGSPPKIGPNEPLVFVVDILESGQAQSPSSSPEKQDEGAESSEEPDTSEKSPTSQKPQD